MELLDFTFGELLEKYAKETPDHEFMVYADRNLRFTYSQFNAGLTNWPKAFCILA